MKEKKILTPKEVAHKKKKQKEKVMRYYYSEKGELAWRRLWNKYNHSSKGKYRDAISKRKNMSDKQLEDFIYNPDKWTSNTKEIDSNNNE